MVKVEYNGYQILRSICVWHQNNSIPVSNPMYNNCIIKCNGYDYPCKQYEPKYNLDKLIEGSREWENTD